ncbi:hypothetical protein HMPREF3226_01955 [Prevotella corporis]|uniref:Uncharacterized protein n=1 Tax=Prevotella corporis TaxID=28128 RepID=A0A133PZ29_9BACT|nr:hypothetical protein HMPREF3226_01955 [Prevotella corporis]
MIPAKVVQAVPFMSKCLKINQLLKAKPLHAIAKSREKFGGMKFYY